MQKSVSCICVFYFYCNDGMAARDGARLAGMLDVSFSLVRQHVIGQYLKAWGRHSHIRRRSFGPTLKQQQSLNPIFKLEGSPPRTHATQLFLITASSLPFPCFSIPKTWPSLSSLSLLFSDTGPLKQGRPDRLHLLCVAPLQSNTQSSEQASQALCFFFW